MKQVKQKNLNLINILFLNPGLSVFLLLLSTCTILFGILLRILAGNMIDNFTYNSQVVNIVVNYFILILVSTICYYLLAYISLRVNDKAQKKIYEQVFTSVLKAKQLWLDQAKKGDFITIFTNDIVQISNYLNRMINRMIPDIFMILLSLSYLAYINFPLAIIAICSAVLPTIVMFYTSKILVNQNKIIQELVSESNETLSESLFNLELLKASNLQDKMVGLYEKGLEKLFKAQRNKAFCEMILNMPIMFLGFGTTLAVAVYGGWLAGTGQISIGKLFSCLTLTEYIVNPIMSMSNSFNRIRQAKVSLERINNIVSCPVESEDLYNEFDLENDIIKFNNVSFSYKGRESVFKQLNLTIKKNQYYFLKGKVGTGKSTLFKLIAGIYAPSDGEILISNTPIEKCNMIIWRSFISVVTQDISLFEGTIIENLRLVKEGASYEEIEQACVLANIHDEIISMPNKYNTLLGVDGFELSGGQRQRLSIAQAFLKGSQIILLDEPTSALDSINTDYIKNSISILSKNKTVLLITHNHNVAIDDAIIIDLDKIGVSS